MALSNSEYFCVISGREVGIPVAQRGTLGLRCAEQWVLSGSAGGRGSVDPGPSWLQHTCSPPLPCSPMHTECSMWVWCLGVGGLWPRALSTGVSSNQNLGVKAALRPLGLELGPLNGDSVKVLEGDWGFAGL